MGDLSIDFKSKILDLLKIFSSLNGFIIFLSLINLSVCIYEDQVGKFDWRQSYVGRIKFAQFDTVSTAKKIIVATEENVLAALHLKTGQIVWRHVLENSPSGTIQLLHVSDHVLSVSGSNPYLVRGWKTSTGVLLWEWSITLNTDHPEWSEWLVQQSQLYHVLPVPGSHVEVTAYNVMTGKNRGATSKLPAVWVNDGCILSPPYYTCVSGSHLLISMDVTSNAVQIISKPLSAYVNPDTFDGALRSLDTSAIPGFIVDDKVLLIKGDQFEVAKTAAIENAGVAVVDTPNGPIVVQTWQDEKGFNLAAASVATGAAVGEAPGGRGAGPPEPELAAALCARAAREPYVCRFLVGGADDSLALVQQEGRVVWSREEALANIVAAEFVDLPVSDEDAAIETEFDQKEGSLWSSFVRRVRSQLAQLAGAALAPEPPAALVRDYFNLHKVIVVATEAGAIFGIDNLSGEVLWRHYRAALDGSRALVFARRSARHTPLDAVVTVVGRSLDTGNAIVIDLNPITGAEQRTAELGAPPLQAALAPRAAAGRLRPLLLLARDRSVQVFPAEAARDVRDVFMYVAQPDATVQGYVLQYDGKQVSAKQTWSASLGGAGARLAAAAAAGAAPRSPARVLADRSVLYKYANPNLLLFVAETPRTNEREGAVTATALDAVTGAVVAAHTTPRARAPSHAVLAEHFFAYTYYSEKNRRTEIVSVELYSGAERVHAAGAAVSAFRRRGPAAAARAAYVLPAAVAAAALTVTERGLTDRHVLLALTSGTIIELPWAYLDPRRASAGAEPREEGLVPYAPELPLPADAAVNYNRSVARVARVAAAPAGLESTCLVLATGLDVFYTRVAPSKTFDLLKDDFDYYLITLVLGALVAATFATKHFADKKQLKMAWK